MWLNLEEEGDTFFVVVVVCVYLWSLAPSCELQPGMITERCGEVRKEGRRGWTFGVNSNSFRQTEFTAYYGIMEYITRASDAARRGCTAVDADTPLYKTAQRRWNSSLLTAQVKCTGLCGTACARSRLLSVRG